MDKDEKSENVLGLSPDLTNQLHVTEDEFWVHHYDPKTMSECGEDNKLSLRLREVRL
jgi:hypothetical protein